MAGKIVVKGARVHNLKNIDVEIPRDQLVVITGVSGSGKSSLAFDTLYAEGQRRYLESLGADARQFLQQMEKPDVDSIEGLSPAIAIQQNTAQSNPRSTVGTLTEIYDYLRLLFARIGQPTCSQCGREISAQTIEQISDQLLSLPGETRIFVKAPVGSGREPDPRTVLQELVRAGFARVKIDGEIHELSEEVPIEAQRPQEIDLIVDRLVLRPGIERRLADSLEVASRVGRQVIKVEIIPGQVAVPAEELIFTQKFVCVQCGISLPEITPRLFSFNTPQGACPACKGLGVESRPRRAGKNADSEPDSPPCRECGGTRLKKESLAVKLDGRSIADLTALPIADARDFLQRLDLGNKKGVVGRKVLQEIAGRLQFLIQLGLEYLTLNRSAVTLSGGEAQRVRLATQLGSSLAGVLYILDEPSIGLHQKDNAQLLATPEAAAGLWQLCHRRGARSRDHSGSGPHHRYRTRSRRKRRRNRCERDTVRNHKQRPFPYRPISVRQDKDAYSNKPSQGDWRVSRDQRSETEQLERHYGANTYRVDDLCDWSFRIRQE